MNSGLLILIVFVVMTVVLNTTGKLYFGVTAGIVSTVLLFGIPLGDALGLAIGSVTSWTCIQMVLILYAITFLQRMLERGGDIGRAQRSMDALSGNRRVNTCLSPIILGFLPSAGVVKICGDIVAESAGDYLDINERAFVANYYRHVSESFLPTYTSVLIAITLSGLSTSSFVLAMLPMVAVQIGLGYFFYLRKLPVKPDTPPSTDRWGDFKTVIVGLWPLLLVIGLILALQVQVLPAVIISSALYILINRVPLSVIPKLLVSAFERRLMINVVLIYIFKDVVTHTGVIQALPALFSALPIPQYLIFTLLFFFGAVIGGSTMIHSIGVPLAFAAIPGGGIPLLVLLTSASYMAMQVSPTHVCLGIVIEHFNITMGGLVKKTIPVGISFMVLAVVYYHILSLVL